ncbi:MAG TPA: hypothetical protein VGX70_19110 [Gemmataceae bacterium]|jgi:hypothetical protein|nr:hypothetical protein [Gemmataceae bacterium]
MVRHSISWVIVGLLLASASALAADGKYSVRSASSTPPKELSEPVAKLLGQESIQFLNAKGETLAEIWLRKEIPVKAGADAKKGVNYRDLDETTLLGAIRLTQPFSDYRKQKIKPGVYTLRLGFQPMNGDHMGTAPFPEFCLLSPAADDKKPDPMDPKDLYELSAKAPMASHPGIMLLFPNDKPQDKPELASKEMDTWVLNVKADVASGGAKAPLGLGLTLVGHSTAE